MTVVQTHVCSVQQLVHIIMFSNLQGHLTGITYQIEHRNKICNKKL